MHPKDKQDSKGQEKEATEKGSQSLSETIADAHAAGDGALERGKDSLIASDDPPADNDANGEAY